MTMLVDIKPLPTNPMPMRVGGVMSMKVCIGAQHTGFPAHHTTIDSRLPASDDRSGASSDNVRIRAGPTAPCDANTHTTATIPYPPCIAPTKQSTPM
jgi:hypothetical protein